VTAADERTRRTISADGLDRTLFVEAGAGTGKTTVLVDRVVNLVTRGDARLAEIAAITFTEAAATELADRIRVEFEKLAATAADAGLRRRCRQAIADADLAAISTLHGFARRILSEHPIAAGLPPRVEVLDEVSSQLAHEARWERFVDALHDDPAHGDLLARAALLGIPLEGRYPGQASMKAVAAALAQSWDRLGPLAQRDHGPLPPVRFGPFDEAVAALEQLVKECDDETDRLFTRLTCDLLPGMRRIAGLDDPDRKLRALALAPRHGSNGRAWSAGNLGTARAWRRCGKRAVHEAVQAVESARRSEVERLSADVLERLLTLVSREVLAAAEARRSEGRLEFHDLLVLARSLLRDSADARLALHQRYRWLLLDEFQDTDPIQIELAVLIAAGVAGDPPRHWEEAPVPEGRLFFVGDPKQSIYRFRRADISLFLKARDRFAPEDSAQRLVTNFRTVEPVVGWVNELFGQLMAGEQPGCQPRYTPLVAHRRADSGGDHRPVALGGPAAGGRVYADQLRQAEAHDVAGAVAAIRSEPESWPVFDQVTARWRPARLPDITVLIPTRTCLPFLRDALAAFDLPYRLDTGTLVYATQEVRDALAALRAVDDPGDELALVAALRSPLYACADTELFTWRRAGGRWDLRHPVPPPALGPDHPVAAALAHLRTLWDQRWWLGPSDLLGRLLAERRAALAAFGHERPTEVWRRLRFLSDQARAFEEAGGGSLRDFLDWAELQGSEGARVHEPVLPETDDRSMRIMTIHGSKGLEFPITVLAGMTTRPARSHRSFSLVWGDDRPELRLGSQAATAAHDPRADLEAEMDHHERLRLLYVACTRARDHLLVSCHHNAGDGSYGSIIWDHLGHRDGRWRRLGPQDPALPSRGAGPAPGGAPRPEDPSRRQEWAEARHALLEPQRRSRFVSATDTARLAGATSTARLAGATGTARLAGATGTARLAGATGTARLAGQAGRGLAGEDDDGSDTGDDGLAVPARRRGRAGTAIGRAVHGTLQLVDLATGDALDELARRQADLEGVPRAAATVADLARSALSSDAVRAALAAPALHREVYVAAPVGDRVVEGYVDLLVERPDGLVVVDYKTDGVRSDAEVDASLAAYELQGAAYAVALEASTGMAVVEVRFVFCRPGGAVERSVADLPTAMDRVRRYLGA
jgi:ATP-dependent exoDNAse (exonuclease V) beta subunit